MSFVLSPPVPELNETEAGIARLMSAAAVALREHANYTPVMRSRTLDAQVGAAVALKCENFQRVGAFKYRGAWHALSQLSEEQRARGVLTFSSGNHAQAMALAGRELGVPVTVVMPDDAPAVKRQATEDYGATVIVYTAAETEREAFAARLVGEHGYTLVPPYDHIDIIAGQGTVALEFYEQAGPLDLLLVPTGGGGLLAGCAIARRSACSAGRVIGVEPELADDATRSFRSGTLQSVHNPPTIADGTRTPSLGTLNFPIVQRHVDDMVTVSEQAIGAAVLFLYERMKLVVEPSGALGVAALLSGAVPAAARTGVILSGGNMDPRLLAELATERDAPT